MRRMNALVRALALVSTVLASIVLVPVVIAVAARPTFAQDTPSDGNATDLPEPRFVGPRSGAARAKIGKKGGANAATERSVAKGLAWLARHAQPSGGWDADGFSAQCTANTTSDGATGEGARDGNGAGDRVCDGVGKGQHGEEIPCPFDGAITALATMAFLGDGHVPGAADDAYADVVENALDRLRGASGAWALPLATQCFAEAEVMTRKGTYRAEVERGVAALLARRQKDGAWGYAAPWRPGSDLPYTALVVQALVTARDAGAELPEDLETGVEKWLQTLEMDKKGRVAYLVDGRRYGYTPTTSNAHCAAAIRTLLRVGVSGASHGRALALVAKQKPIWKISFREVKRGGKTYSVQVGNLTMYQWWYGTLAAHQTGGSAWSGWYGKLKGQLVGHQTKTGCAAGSWDPLGTYERQTGGRVFATALGVLMLEEPYRHLALK